MNVKKFKKDVEDSFTDLEHGKMKKKVKFDFSMFSMPMWTSKNVLYLISQAVKNLGEGESYLNYGIWQGATLLIPAYFNRGKRCDGLDNWSSSNWNGQNEDKVKALIEQHKLENVNVYTKDYREFLGTYANPRWNNPKYGVAFLDGEHSYECTLEALKLVKACMADDCVIIVDDISEEPPVLKAVDEFLRTNKDFNVMWELPKIKGDKEQKIWWSGIMVLQRGLSEKKGK